VPTRNDELLQPVRKISPSIHVIERDAAFLGQQAPYKIDLIPRLIKDHPIGSLTLQNFPAGEKGADRIDQLDAKYTPLLLGEFQIDALICQQKCAQRRTPDLDSVERQLQERLRRYGRGDMLNLPQVVGRENRVDIVSWKSELLPNAILVAAACVANPDPRRLTVVNTDMLCEHANTIPAECASAADVDNVMPSLLKRFRNQRLWKGMNPNGRMG
jgi:hypothetical protein